MKNLFSIFLVLVALVSCTSCKKETLSVPDTQEDVSIIFDSSKVETQLFSGTTWELSVPFGWNKITSTVPPIEVKVFIFNPDYKNVIIFAVEDFPGTYEEYVAFALRGITDSGAHMLSAETVSLNGTTFLLLTSEKDSATSWLWVATKNGVGYALSCAAPTIDFNKNHDICLDVFISLKLK